MFVMIMAINLQLRYIVIIELRQLFTHELRLEGWCGVCDCGGVQCSVYITTVYRINDVRICSLI